jgi:hypothetical protein
VIQIEPDAFFTFRDAAVPEGERMTRIFLLEADRSTMPKKSGREAGASMTSSENMRRTSVPAGLKRLSASPPSKFALTSTKLRRDGLASSAPEALTEGFHKYFLFGSLEDFSFEDQATIFTPVFKRPADPEARRPLMLRLQK